MVEPVVAEGLDDPGLGTFGFAHIHRVIRVEQPNIVGGGSIINEPIKLLLLPLGEDDCLPGFEHDRVTLIHPADLAFRLRRRILPNRPSDRRDLLLTEWWVASLL